MVQLGGSSPILKGYQYETIKSSELSETVRSNIQRTVRAILERDPDFAKELVTGKPGSMGRLIDLTEKELIVGDDEEADVLSYDDYVRIRTGVQAALCNTPRSQVM